MANRLDQFRAELFTDLRDHAAALFTFPAGYFYLHEFMVRQRQFDFTHDRRAEARVANADDGFEGVTARTQFAPCLFRE